MNARRVGTAGVRTTSVPSRQGKLTICPETGMPQSARVSASLLAQCPESRLDCGHSRVSSRLDTEPARHHGMTARARPVTEIATGNIAS